MLPCVHRHPLTDPHRPETQQTSGRPTLGAASTTKHATGDESHTELVGVVEDMAGWCRWWRRSSVESVRDDRSSSGTIRSSVD